MHSIDAASDDERVKRYEDLARKALSVYALQDAELRFLGPGTNIVFRVQTDDGRWALRISHPDRDRNELMRELLWLVAINRDTPLSVPEPIIMRSGELLRSVSMPGIHGFHPCVLFRWVRGQFAEEPSGDHLRAVGRFTAVLHQHAAAFRWPEELAIDAAPLERLAERLSSERVRSRLQTEDAETLQEAIPAIRRTAVSLGNGHEVAGVVHGDLRQGNVLFQDGEARAIDFERTHWNYYAYDVAVTLGELAHRADFPHLRDAYLEGYEAVHPVPCDPHEHLPAFEAMHAIARTLAILHVARFHAGSDDDTVHAAVVKVRRWLDTV